MSSKRTPPPADGFPDPLAGFDHEVFKVKEEVVVSGSPKQFGLFVKSERIGANTKRARFVLPFPSNLDVADSQSRVLVHIIAHSGERIGEIQALSLPDDKTLIRLKVKNGSRHLWKDGWLSLLSKMEKMGWKLFSPEGLVKSRRPGSQGLSDDELALRFSYVILAEDVKRDNPDASWKHPYREVRFVFGSTEDSRYQTFLRTKGDLEHARASGEQDKLIERARQIAKEKKTNLNNKPCFLCRLWF